MSLNTSTSIVDKLKSEGKDSSYSARKALAESSGISNYTGTAEQNTKLLSLTSKSVNPIINNQSKIISSTTAEKGKINSALTGIDSILNSKNNTNTQIDPKTGKLIVNTTSVNENNTSPDGNIQDSNGSKYFSSMPKDLTYQLPELKNDKKWVFDASGKPFEMDASGKITSNTVAEQEYNTNVQKNKDIQTQNDIYDALKENISEAHKLVIDNIKKKAETMRTSMEEINKQYLGAKKVAGFRTGATEYTPEIAMGILKNEEEQGLARIKEIDDNMTLALAEAVTAKNGKDLQLAQQQFENYTKLQKEKETAIIDQYKLYMDGQKYIEDVKKAAKTEERAVEDQAMQKLDKSADAYLKGYNAAKNKNAYVESIATKLGLDKDIVLGQILAAQPKPKSGSGKQTITEIKSSAIGDMAVNMDNVAGTDGYIDPYMWIKARKAWVAEGLNDADFLKNFKQYLNPASYNRIPEFAKKTTVKRGS